MTRPSPYQRGQHNLKVGERVRLVSVPEALLAGLDAGDIAAIRAVVGKIFAVMGFDAKGDIELEFRTKDDILHTIWVPPACVKKLQHAPRR